MRLGDAGEHLMHVIGHDGKEGRERKIETAESSIVPPVVMSLPHCRSQRCSGLIARCLTTFLSSRHRTQSHSQMEPNAVQRVGPSEVL